MYIWHIIKCCVKFHWSELHFQLASCVNCRYYFFFPCKILLLKYGYKIAIRVLCQLVSTISTWCFPLEQLIHYTLFMLWNYHALEWIQTRDKKLFVSRLHKCGISYQLIQEQLRAFPVLRWNWNNTSWWLEVVVIVSIDVILELSWIILYLYAFVYHRSCLKMGFHLNLHSQLTNIYMYVYQLHLFIFDSKTICILRFLSLCLCYRLRHLSLISAWLLSFQDKPNKYVSNNISQIIVWLTDHKLS